jgi:hypothetical protein
MKAIDTEHLIMVNIDGLRPDAFATELHAGTLPNLKRLLGGEGAEDRLIPCVSTAPSITFCAQASIATGAHPSQHGIPGNDFFDRTARFGAPRHFGFDVGDTYAVNDAVSVFRSRLADEVLQPTVPTLYESVRARGGTSLVAHSMYARGATGVISPSILDLARITKLRGVFGLGRGEFDSHMLRQVDRQLAKECPTVLAVYLMGLDKESHELGPHVQGVYLREVLDAQIGRLLESLQSSGMLESALIALVSDHGQSATSGDDVHSIRLGFPFDQELVHLFHALRLDVHDLPGEDPHVDAVVGLNGGLAHVYLRNREGEWDNPPVFERDILPIAEAFAEMNERGAYCEELKGTLDLILVRDSSSGWNAPYRAWTGGGALRPIEEIFAERGANEYPDAAARLQLLNSQASGDLLLLARSERGVYFGKPGLRGVHGGLRHDDSEASLALVIAGGTSREHDGLRDTFIEVLKPRMEIEGRKRVSIADLVFGLRSLWPRAALD